ncbi:penicillin-binding transpeptidase domain-containing protein, partial [Longimycelium tulufanense]
MSTTSWRRWVLTGGGLVAVGVIVAGVVVLSKPGAGTATGESSTPPAMIDAPDRVVAQFFTAAGKGDTEAAAKLTDDPAAAAAFLNELRVELRSSAVTLKTGNVDRSAAGNQATVSYRADWNLGSGRTWSYDGTIQLNKGARWRVKWSPAAVHPRLGAGQKLELRQDDRAAAVTDSTGRPLLTWKTGVTVRLDRAQARDLSRVAQQLATALAPLDPDVTRQAIVDGAGKVPAGQPYEVVTLDESDYDKVRSQIYDLPGVSFRKQQKIRGVDPELRSFVMGGLAREIEQQRANDAPWRIVVADASGNEVEVLHAESGARSRPVQATLDARTQKAAQHALQALPNEAALVAIQPSTGEIRAVAQNRAAKSDIALQGILPPGSTFKMVTASAVLQAGLAQADTPLPCPAEVQVGSRRIPNDHKFDLGTVSLRTAFAHSCNTTFAELATKLPADALSKAAQQLGLGADYVIPGITTVTGKVPPDPVAENRMDDSIGQGEVTASPFGMALATATMASGKRVTPVLLRGTRTEATGTAAPPPPAVAHAVRNMMREVVTDGTARKLNGFPGLHGKTGTAEFDNAGNSHGWFVGFQGDLAFAVVVLEANASAPAVDVAGSFLSAIS